MALERWRNRTQIRIVGTMSVYKQRIIQTRFIILFHIMHGVYKIVYGKVSYQVSCLFVNESYIMYVHIKYGYIMYVYTNDTCRHLYTNLLRVNLEVVWLRANHYKSLSCECLCLCNLIKQTFPTNNYTTQTKVRVTKNKVSKYHGCVSMGLPSCSFICL